MAITTRHVAVLFGKAQEDPGPVTGYRPTAATIDDQTDTSSWELVASLSAVHPGDGFPPFTYAIQPGGDAANFRITGGSRLEVNDGVLDVVTKNQYSCTIRVTDDEGNFADVLFKLTVAPIPPQITSLVPSDFSILINWMLIVLITLAGEVVTFLGEPVWYA